MTEIKDLTPEQFIRYYHSDGSYTRCRLLEDYDFERYGWVLEKSND